MAWMDWIIIAILVLSVLGAAKKGFFVESFSLAGVILGLLLASWNYQRLVPWEERWIHPPQLAEVMAFLGIALGVMILSGLVGRGFRWAAKSVGLGWADRCIGALFGFLRGCILVTLGVMAIAAFVPSTGWLEQSRLASYFLSVAHTSTVITPSEFGERIRQGIKLIRQSQPEWLQPKAEIAPISRFS
jgi:membrane protein required for colicin V production